MKYLISILTLFLAFSSFGQINYAEDDSSSLVERSNGSITISEDAMVATALYRHKSYNKHNNRHMGFRVQIASADVLDEVMDEKTTCLINWPKLEVEVEYDQPYYKLKVGNFRDRLGAYRYLMELQETFPAAFMIRDEIDIEELYDHKVNKR